MEREELPVDSQAAAEHEEKEYPEHNSDSDIERVVQWSLEHTNDTHSMFLLQA